MIVVETVNLHHLNPTLQRPPLKKVYTKNLEFALTLALIPLVTYEQKNQVQTTPAKKHLS